MFRILILLLLASATVPATAQPARLFLQERASETPLGETFTFIDAQDVGNYYGSTDPAYALARDYYSLGFAATLLFTRFPTAPARAHLVGADVSTVPLSLIMSLTGNLSVVSDGATYSICVGTASECTGSGLPNADLTQASSFPAVATTLAGAFNANQIVVGRLRASAIAPQSASFSIVTSTGASVTISGVTGTIEPGGYVCAASNPCKPASADYLGQITFQVPWETGSVTGGAGVYTLITPPPSAYQNRNLSAVESYGVLMVGGSQNFGTLAPGQHIHGISSTASAMTFAEGCIANCGSAGAQWIVNYSQTVASESMYVSAPPLVINWNSVSGPTESWGYFDVQHNGNAIFTGSSISCMTGTPAMTLGLACGSTGSQRLQYTNEYAAPSGVVTDVNTWMTAYYTANPSFYSCEATYTSVETIPNLPATLQTWGKGAKVSCPAAWVTTPVSTPPAN